MMKLDDTQSFELFKEQLLNEWMKENPPFDNDKQSFEDYLVREIRKQDANQTIQLIEQMKINAALRCENRDLRNANADEKLMIVPKYIIDNALDAVRMAANTLESRKRETAMDRQIEFTERIP